MVKIIYNVDYTKCLNSSQTSGQDIFMTLLHIKEICVPKIKANFHPRPKVFFLGPIIMLLLDLVKKKVHAAIAGEEIHSTPNCTLHVACIKGKCRAKRIPDPELEGQRGT